MAAICYIKLVGKKKIKKDYPAQDSDYIAWYNI